MERSLIARQAVTEVFEIASRGFSHTLHLANRPGPGRDEKNIRLSVNIVTEQEGLQVITAPDVSSALRVLHERIGKCW